MQTDPGGEPIKKTHAARPEFLFGAISVGMFVLNTMSRTMGGYLNTTERGWPWIYFHSCDVCTEGSSFFADRFLLDLLVAGVIVYVFYQVGCRLLTAHHPRLFGFRFENLSSPTDEIKPENKAEKSTPRKLPDQIQAFPRRDFPLTLTEI
jgi:hypothetical protein